MCGGGGSHEDGQVQLTQNVCLDGDEDEKSEGEITDSSDDGVPQM